MAALKKTEKVNLRMDSDAHDTISRAAEICGKSLTAFMTEAAVYSAQKELLDQRFIGVDASVFDNVDALLSREGKPNDELIKLFKSNIAWID
ncbi:type II toxin-antitoxin system TacA family antitoxin [Phyllobacterium lublinensis]|uniref:type II toxin-antitoxin system TacA family antitoxin n=1 Tax=Phyllobacterium lublinensis TaxID=2875708 RepID=UPI001CCCD649|nr:DUF1778 domain-containing protein [Phyllobacterium sp. 2063]MBZ9655036.1 DUF1778 domain-containing protein [Phyllobacterium sp. 2063]